MADSRDERASQRVVTDASVSDFRRDETPSATADHGTKDVDRSSRHICCSSRSIQISLSSARFVQDKYLGKTQEPTTSSITPIPRVSRRDAEIRSES